jgi:hypothetical protein
MRVRFARAARKHRVPRAGVLHVIEHASVRIREPPIAGSKWPDDRLIYLGDDARGVALEIMAIELEHDELLVIHAMPLRTKYQEQYQEAKQWQR